MEKFSKPENVKCSLCGETMRKVYIYTCREIKWNEVL